MSVRLPAASRLPQPCARLPTAQGGRFSIYGGSVRGVFRELEPNRRLAMDWRFRCGFECVCGSAQAARQFCVCLEDFCPLRQQEGT